MASRKEITVTAKTVEEAAAEGAQRLGAPEEAVAVEVLQEPKKGFLGIGELPAVVKVSYEPSRADIAEQFLRTYIEGVGVRAEVRRVSEQDGCVFFDISGEGAGALIGYHGETLDALQILSTLAANRVLAGEEEGDYHEGYLRVSLDAGGYRGKRDATLATLAKRTADRVRRTGRPVTLEPMNASDRRAVHTAVQAIPGVESESTGSEGHRCVVIYPAQ